jgi:hypothetical protein
VANFWRAVKADPKSVAEYADNPVFENDLHARHVWLLQRRETLRSQLEGDPEYFDAKIAGWWVWGICFWIGGGFCSGNGPWWIDKNRQLVHLGNDGRGEQQSRLIPWFLALAYRLARVRVCSGDWSRVCGPSVTFKHGLTGVFLDPPYADTANRTSNLYREDSELCAHAVREWAVDNGNNPLMRIALCGYEGEHEMPESWSVLSWNAGKGYGADGENGKKERIWFSPSCLGTMQCSLF